MERKVLIIHHNDMDGKFSGALIYNYEKNKKNADWIKCIEVDYTMNLVNIIDEDILTLEGLVVYFVDYSFSKKENTDIILSILDNNGRVVWIDHHVSSKNVLASLPDEICNDNRFKVIIDTKYCATVLCYEYTSTIKNDKAFLNLVDSWDCWKHTVPDDRFFNEGFRSMHYFVEELGDIVGDILKNKDAEDRFINKMIDEYVKSRPNCIAFASLGSLRYLSALKHVDIILGNSSSGLLEAPSMGVATINIGPRQDGRLKAPSIIDIKPIKAQILKAIKLAYSPKFQKIVQKKQNPYGNSKPSKTIVKVLKNINLKDITVKRFKDLV